MVYALILAGSLLASGLSLISPALRRTLGLLTAIALVLLAGLRGASVDYDDYLLLLAFMEQAETIDLPARLFVGKDPLFGALLVWNLGSGLTPQWLFLVSAALSVGLKWLAFERALHNAATGLLASLCLYYFLHDFTQVRVAVALAWSFVALAELLRGHRWRWLLLMLIATGFHASSAMLMLYMPLLLASGRWRWFATAALTGALLIAIPLSLSSLGAFDARAEVHADVTGVGWIPLALSLLRLATFGGLVWSLQKRAPEFRTLLTCCFALCCVAAVFLFGLRDTSSAWAFRTYELFDAFSIFIVAVAFMRASWPGRLAALIPCAASLGMYVSAGLLVPYTLGEI